MRTRYAPYVVTEISETTTYTRGDGPYFQRLQQPTTNIEPTPRAAKVTARLLVDLDSYQPVGQTGWHVPEQITLHVDFDDAPRLHGLIGVQFQWAPAEEGTGWEPLQLHAPGEEG